jgi:hypothetical protein
MKFIYIWKSINIIATNKPWPTFSSHTEIKKYYFCCWWGLLLFSICIFYIFASLRFLLAFGLFASDERWKWSGGLAANMCVCRFVCLIKHFLHGWKELPHGRPFCNASEKCWWKTIEINQLDTYFVESENFCYWFFASFMFLLVFGMIWHEEQQQKFTYSAVVRWKMRLPALSFISFLRTQPYYVDSWAHARKWLKVRINARKLKKPYFWRQNGSLFSLFHSKNRARA